MFYSFRILTDRWFYGRWLFTPLNYFQVNVIEGKSADWGTSPWWDYFVMIVQNNIPLLELLFSAASLFFSFALYKHPLTWIAVLSSRSYDQWNTRN